MTSVIIVDDDKDLNESIETMLELNEIKVVGIGTNGKEAFELYKQKKPDLVLTDWNMPVYDGKYAIEKIRDYDPDAKIFLVSGSEAIHSFSVKYTPNGFISKPIDIINLIHEIKLFGEEKKQYVQT